MSSSEHTLSIATLIDRESVLDTRLQAAELSGRPLLAVTDRPLRTGFVDAIDGRSCDRAEARNRLLDKARGWVLWLEEGERLEPEACVLLSAWLRQPEDRGGPGNALAAPVHIVDESGVPRRAVRLMRAHPGVRFVGGDAEAPEIDGSTHPSPVLTVHKPLLGFDGFDQAAALFQSEDPVQRKSALETLRTLAQQGAGEIRILAMCAFVRYLQHQGNHDEALSLAFSALRLDPRFAEIHCLLGDLYRSLNELEKARLWYRSAWGLRRPPPWTRHCDPLKYGWEPQEGIEACNRGLPLDRRDAPRFRRVRPRAPERVSVVIACSGLPGPVLEGFATQTWQDRELLVLDDGPEPDLALRNSQDPRVSYQYLPTPTSLGTKLELARELVYGGRIVLWEPQAAYGPRYLERLAALLEDQDLVYLAGLWLLRAEDRRCGFLRPSKKHEDRGYFGSCLAFRHSVFQKVSFRDSDDEALLFFIEEAEARGYASHPLLDSEGLCLLAPGRGDLATGLADFERVLPPELANLQATLVGQGSRAAH